MFFCLNLGRPLTSFDICRQGLVAGNDEGVLAYWDIRNTGSPISTIKPHLEPIWNVKFHPNDEKRVYTCSQDGTVWYIFI